MLQPPMLTLQKVYAGLGYTILLRENDSRIYVDINVLDLRVAG